jgi:DNA polymerase-3 subunit delta'
MDKLVGHRWAASLLQNGIDTGKVTHAYLIQGATGVGKSRLALDFALALGCQNPPDKEGQISGLRYCGKCRACRMISEAKHPDVSTVGLEWQAQMEGGNRDGNIGANLKVETIRSIVNGINYDPPKELRWRIFIIKEAETMRAEAANAFLKTLEEPPSRAILILIANSGRPILPTILSRCQVVELRPVPKTEIVQALQNEGASLEEAETLAAIAAGRPGWALQAYRTKANLTEREEALQQMNSLLPADKIQRTFIAEEIAGRWQSGGDKRAGVLSTFNVWLGWWRDLALVRQNLDNYVSNVDKLAELQVQAKKLSPVQIKDMLGGITRAQAELESNVAPRMAINDLFLNRLPYSK